MKSKSILFVGALGIAMLAPLAPQTADAQVSKQGPAYLLRMKFVKGQVFKYSIVTTGAMIPNGQKMTSTMTVKDVKNGIATIDSVVSMPQGAAGRNSKPVTQTLQMDSRGKVVGKATASMGGAATPTLPERAVKIGESWNGDMKMGGGINVTATYTLLSVKTVGAKTIAEIGQKVTGNMGAMGRMSGQGRMQLDGRDGSMLGGSVNMSVVMSGGQDPKAKPQTMTFATKITRL